MTLNSSDPDIVAAINTLARPDRQAIRLVWDTVFWRRCLYALTVSLTFVLAIYPLIAAPASSAVSWLMGIDRATRGPVADIVNAFSALIPGYVAPWKNALNEHPLLFFLIVISILASLAGSVTLERRIRDRARMAWDRQFRDGYLAWLAQTRNAWRNGLRTLFAVSLVGVLLGLCYPPARYALGFFSAFAAGSLLLQGLRVLGAVEPKKGTASRTRIPSTFALSLARALRTNRPLRAGFRLVANHVAPAALMLVLLAGATLLLNRATFDLTSAAGRFCHGTPGLDETKEVTTAEVSGFTTSDLCWASGLVLKKGHRYEITLTTPGDWRDREYETDVLGMPNEGLPFILGVPLKRWWGATWFQPIARIGDVGNVEIPLAPLDDAAPPDRGILRTRITAEADGELFLFVNDAVLGLPGMADTFMKNNSGTASVKVRRLGLRNAATPSGFSAVTPEASD